MLSLLAIVNGSNQNNQAVDEKRNRGARETLIDVPADELKQMILSLIQDGGPDASQSEDTTT